MELKFAVLADYVSETKEGKLNIMGTFSGIRAQKVPAVHPRCYIAARFHARVSEGTDHTFRIGLYDADGGEVRPLTPDLPLQFTSNGPGRPFVGTVIVDMPALQLPNFGDYEFHILIDGRVMAEVPLSLTEIERPPKNEPS
jgi:hypothetical protein